MKSSMERIYFLYYIRKNWGPATPRHPMERWVMLKALSPLRAKAMPLASRALEDELLEAIERLGRGA